MKAKEVSPFVLFARHRRCIPNRDIRERDP